MEQKIDVMSKKEERRILTVCAQTKSFRQVIIIEKL